MIQVNAISRNHRVHLNDWYGDNKINMLSIATDDNGRVTKVTIQKDEISEHRKGINKVLWFIQYFARNWPWYSLRGLHIRITWFSLYGIRIPLFSLYGIHMPLFPYMVILPIVLGVALLWAAMDSPLSQGRLLWRHNDMTVIVSPDSRGPERGTRQRLDNANARRLQTFNR